MLKSLTKGEEFIFNWQYGLLGSFEYAIAKAVTTADIHNLNKLSKCFPDEVEAYICYANVEGWWQRVQEKAKEEGK